VGKDITATRLVISVKYYDAGAAYPLIGRHPTGLSEEGEGERGNCRRIIWGPREWTVMGSQKAGREGTRDKEKKNKLDHKFARGKWGAAGSMVIGGVGRNGRP